jgi:hypothetical protein
MHAITKERKLRKTRKGSRGVAGVYLISKHEALSSNTSTTLPQKKNSKGGAGEGGDRWGYCPQ